MCFFCVFTKGFCFLESCDILVEKGGGIVVRQSWRPGVALPCVRRSVALGVFDGMHLGHRAVIAAARNVTSPSASIPFPTVTVLSLTGVPKSGGRLISEQQECEQARTLGVDEWLSVSFESVRHFSPQEFVDRVLYRALQAQVVCCGYNFRFGLGGVGDAALLKTLCEPLGIEVRVVPEVKRDGATVSSTVIRRALADGDPERARGFLGRPYALTLPVGSGDHRGTGWGVPTLNQLLPPEYAVPRYGVYASLVVLDGVQHRAITNLGIHPTVGGANAPQAETYVEDYSGDLYGQTVTVELIRFFREERCFESVEQLRTQIANDLRTAHTTLGGDGGRAVLFDFDDTLQDRATAFLGAAQEMLRRAFPTLSADELTQRAQQMLEENCGGYVDYHEYFQRLKARWDWPAEADALWQEFQRRFPFYTAPFSDAERVLRELKRRGYRLGVITNGVMPQQNLKLDASALRPLLDVVLIGGEEGVAKPSPEVFRRAAQRLCVSPEKCVYVGDYPPNDLVGAQRAGMVPLYLDMSGQDDRFPEVERITSLPELLDRLE